MPENCFAADKQPPKGQNVPFLFLFFGVWQSIAQGALKTKRSTEKLGSCWELVLSVQGLKSIGTSFIP